MVNKEANELLDDIMLDKIAQMSDKQLNKELNHYVSDLDVVKARVVSRLTSHLSLIHI